MSSLPRLYSDSPLAIGVAAPASAEQAHYLANVMRRAPGDEVVLFNGRHGEFLARINAVSRKAVEFMPLNRLREQAAEPDLWLVFALLKRDATDFVLRAATELGVSRFIPVITERTNASRVNLERLHAIAREAAEQCERLTLPEINQPVDFYELLSTWPVDRTLAAAIERETGSNCDQTPPGALLIGPEGGFSSRELDFMRATPFICALTLGPRILRAETAAIAGLTALQLRNWSNA